MINGIKSIYFDFGFVIGYPRPDIEKRYLYLNWDGIPSLLNDKAFSSSLKTGVGLEELNAFFKEEIYEVFLKHEQSDLVDPQSGKLLFERLPKILKAPATQELVDTVLFHVNTMKYLEIYPNVKDILSELTSRGYSLSMISNMMLPGKLLIQKLQENDIAHFFKTVTVSSDIGLIKPRQEMFELTLEIDGLKPHEVLFIGDTYAQDMIGAKRAGMKTIWLNVRNEAISDRSCVDIEIKQLEDMLMYV